MRNLEWVKKGKIQDLFLKDRRTYKFECVDK